MMKEIKRIETYKNFIGELTAIYRRTENPTFAINSSKDAATFMYSYFNEIMDDHEEAKILYMNNANKIVSVQNLSSGTDSACLVSVPDVLRHAIILKAKGFIFFHNHPSGKLKPSQGDKMLLKS